MFAFGLPELLILGFAALFSFAGQKAAREKGRSPIIWGILCFFFPFMIVLPILLKSKIQQG